MNTEQKTLRQQIEAFKNGEYNDPDKQCEAGWFDWFCKDSSLVNKTKTLYPKVAKISKSSKFDADKTYVLFKNNCPMSGSLYDDFRICDIVTGDVIFTVTPKSGHISDNGLGEVWGKENDFECELFKGTWREIVQWFLAEKSEFNYRYFLEEVAKFREIMSSSYSVKQKDDAFEGLTLVYFKFKSEDPSEVEKAGMIFNATKEEYELRRAIALRKENNVTRG